MPWTYGVSGIGAKLEWDRVEEKATLELLTKRRFAHHPESSHLRSPLAYAALPFVCTCVDWALDTIYLHLDS